MLVRPNPMQKAAAIRTAVFGAGRIVFMIEPLVV
jgi:hypothetical protein